MSEPYQRSAIALRGGSDMRCIIWYFSSPMVVPSASPSISTRSLLLSVLMRSTCGAGAIGALRDMSHERCTVCGEPIAWSVVMVAEAEASARRNLEPSPTPPSSAIVTAIHTLRWPRAR